jgi:hypothetical protein
MTDSEQTIGTSVSAVIIPPARSPLDPSDTCKTRMTALVALSAALGSVPLASEHLSTFLDELRGRSDMDLPRHSIGYEPLAAMSDQLAQVTSAFATTSRLKIFKFRGSLRRPGARFDY